MTCLGACAGLSLGEYCALVFAGVLTFEEGLRVVKVRAESMAAAATAGLSSQVSLVPTISRALMLRISASHCTHCPVVR